MYVILTLCKTISLTPILDLKVMWVLQADPAVTAQGLGHRFHSQGTALELLQLASRRLTHAAICPASMARPTRRWQARGECVLLDCRIPCGDSLQVRRGFRRYSRVFFHSFASTRVIPSGDPKYLSKSSNTTNDDVQVRRPPPQALTRCRVYLLPRTATLPSASCQRHLPAET